MKFLKEKNGGSRKQIITARPATIRLREKRQMQIASGAPVFWLPPTRASQVAHLSAGISRHSVHFIHFIRSNSIESFDVGENLK